MRGANAYVPPGARRQQASTDGAATATAKGPDKVKDKDKEKENKKPETPVPKVAVNAPDNSEKALPKGTASPSAPVKVRFPSGT